MSAGVNRALLSIPKMRWSCSDPVISLVATRQEKLPVELILLGLREKGFAALERSFALGALDGDTGNVGDLGREILLRRCGSSGLAMQDGDDAQNMPGQ